MVAPEKWITDETVIKEQHFRGILKMHIGICRGIYSRWRKPPPYLYVDCHGGPGILELKGRTFDGSPVIAHDLLGTGRLAYEAVHFENDPEIAARLDVTLAAAGSPRSGSHTVTAEDCEVGLPRWCLGSGYPRDCRGLIYSDPIGDPIPVEALNVAAARFPKVDILAYVAANDQYKRVNGGRHGHGRTLVDDIASVDKRTVLIREPRTTHQWTFILWSNWVDFPQWEKIGFVNADSPSGRAHLEKANFTRQQIRERANTPLPFEWPDEGMP